MMIVYGAYSVDKILPLIGINDRVCINGYYPKCSSLRLLCFKRSLICAACGIQGNIFLLETHRPETKPHLNLYHVDLNTFDYTRSRKDDRILMSKDHVLPVSKGGKDSLQNLQTMCLPCNERKDSTIGVVALRFPSAKVIDIPPVCSGEHISNFEKDNHVESK